MREIKFRGKRTDNGEWVYGYHSAPFEISDYEYYTNKSPRTVYIDRNTIGEFTGFYDCDGKEIYEDDIIQRQKSSELIYKVVMREGNWSVIFDGDDYNDLYLILASAPHKIVGNVFDNPELLEGGKDND